MAVTPLVQERSARAYAPTPADRFSFGLWTVGNVGRDPFGDHTRQPLDPLRAVQRLGELGAYGVSFHDDDLVPFGSSSSERDGIVRRFRGARKDAGMVASMATTNLFWHPPSRTARSRPMTRPCAATPSPRPCEASTLASSWAPIPTSSGAAARASRQWPRNRPRSRSTASAKRWISCAATPWTRATTFVSRWNGIWDFAAGCMRTYLILAEKARRFDRDPEIQAALRDAGVPDLSRPTVGAYSRSAAEALLAEHFDVDALAQRGYRNDHLDQLVVELLLGIR